MTHRYIIQPNNVVYNGPDAHRLKDISFYSAVSDYPGMPIQTGILHSLVGQGDLMREYLNLDGSPITLHFQWPTRKNVSYSFTPKLDCTRMQLAYVAINQVRSYKTANLASLSLDPDLKRELFTFDQSFLGHLAHMGDHHFRIVLHIPRVIIYNPRHGSYSVSDSEPPIVPGANYGLQSEKIVFPTGSIHGNSTIASVTWSLGPACVVQFDDPKHRICFYKMPQPFYFGHLDGRPPDLSSLMSSIKFVDATAPDLGAGISLQRTSVLLDPHEPILCDLHDAGSSIVVRILWPGYEMWTSTISPKDYRTRLILAGTLRQIIGKNTFKVMIGSEETYENAVPYAESEALHWRIGSVAYILGTVSPTRIHLVSLDHMGGNNFQVTLYKKVDSADASLISERASAASKQLFVEF